MSTNTRKLTADQERQAAMRRGQRIAAMEAGQSVPLLGLNLADAIREHEARGTLSDLAVIALIRGQASAIPGQATFPPARQLAQQPQTVPTAFANEAGSICTVTLANGKTETYGLGPFIRRR